MTKGSNRACVWMFVGFVALLLAPLSPASAAVPSFEVSEYMQDFGVPQEVAEENLAVQQRGMGIVGELKAALRDDYAGVWFDNEAGEFVIPLLSGSDSAAVHEQLAEANLAGHYRTVPAATSWVELEEDQARIDEELLAPSQSSLVQTFLDPRTNAVVVRLADGSSKTEAAEVHVLESTQLEVRDRAEDQFSVNLRACKTSTPRACDKPLRGGVAITPEISGCCVSTGECTAGFKAVDKLSGDRFMLTAGHCAAKFSRWGSENASGSSFPIGDVQGYSFPGGDWAKIKATGSEWDAPSWPSQVAHYWEDQNRAINAESYSYLGQYVCHSGNKTGTSCGNVLAINVTFTDEVTKQTVYHLTEFGEVCGYYGDSGGPVFAGNTALGIYNAGASSGKECPPGSGQAHGENGFYAEITEATDALGVTVGTRIGSPPSGKQKPTVETKAVSDLTETQVKLNATVNPNGQWTTYHFEWGKTTNYGNRIPIPDGNIGGGTGTAVAYDTIGVTPRTRYHYRIVATNASGTSSGENKSFTTGIRWVLRNSNSGGGADKDFWFGVPGERRVFGDWDGNGTQTPGVYNPVSGIWKLRNSASTGPPDITFQYGGGAWETPVVGDWDDNGTDTIGVYDREPGNWALRNSNSAGATNHAFQYGGGAAETAVVGNWDGKGTDTIGVYDQEPGNWTLRNCTCGGPPDYSFQYGGGPWKTGIIGDWNGDATDTIGVHDPDAGNWNLRNSNSSGGPNYSFQYGGGPQFIAVAGDWDSNGTTTPGLADVNAGTAIAWQLRNSNSAGAPQIVFDYGEDVQVHVVGDWDGDGDETVGRYNPDTGVWRLRNSNSEGPTEIDFQYGGGPWRNPIAGDWDGDGDETIGIYDPVLGNWRLRNSNSSGLADIEFHYGGGPWTNSIAGDWNGDGSDTIGVYDPGPGNWNLRNSNSNGLPDYSFQYGGGVWTGSIVGDWDNNGTDTIGAYDPQAGNWNLRNSNTTGGPNISFQYGGQQFRPVVGDWDKDGDDTAGLVTWGR